MDAHCRGLLERALCWLIAMLVALVMIACGDEAVPPLAEPRTIAPNIGTTQGGDPIAILGQGFTQGSLVLFDGIPARDVFVSTGAITAKTPAHAVGMVKVTVVDSLGRVAKVPGKFEYATILSQKGGPRVVAATSLSNTSVRVNFNEPVSASADSAGSYSIVQSTVNPESGVLLVLAAELSDDGLSVLLTTGSQNEVTYTLIASDIRDLDGELLAPPEAFLKPNQAQFAGTPPSASGTLLDADIDGLSDNQEQSGWTVTIQLGNGDILQSTVTSDPTQADTDADGLSDRRELLAGSNPRNADTDGDGINDPDEIDKWHSNPTRQDTDKDGLSDAAEIAFNTSPILDDTDGDGMDDRDELFLYNRNPLIANLPRPQIVVGEYSLQVKLTSSYTDVTGTTHSSQSTIQSGVSQVQASSIARSDTRSTETAVKRSQEIGVEAGIQDGKFAGKITGKAGFEQANAQGFSSTVDAQTATQSQETYEKSISEAFDQSELQSITRTIDSANVQATISVANQGEVPFTITNMEISLLRQDRSSGGAFTPVASLRPSGQQSLAINLGPFDTERGPIIFENSDVFPNIVDDLIREPQGLVFKVANFDVLDADGNNFAFSSATVSNRTAGVTIDYGDGRVESFRIATHNAFGTDGLPTGITMKRALEIAGLALVAEDSALPEPLPSNLDPSVTQSVGTRRQGANGSGPERLVRVRGVQNDLRGTANPEKRFWAVFTNNLILSSDADFSTIQLGAGDEVLLVHTRDIDQDGLYELEEFLYGSSDRSKDTDEDGLLDFDEVRTGWSVSVKPGSPRRVFSSPARVDSDLDGLSDKQEREHGTDPNRQDTDNDGLSDRLEILETLSLPLGDIGAPNPRILHLSPYSDAAIFAVADGTVALAAAGDDQQVAAVGSSVLAGAVVIAPGPNGSIETVVPEGGIEAFRAPSYVVAGPSIGSTMTTCTTTADATTRDVQVVAAGTVVTEGTICVAGGSPDFKVMTPVPLDSTDFARIGHERRFTLDPTRADTDLDGIPDGRETRIGLNPNSNDAARFIDSDQDGLGDALEDNGWRVCVPRNSATGCRDVKPSKVLADSDFDGVPDVIEYAIQSDPSRSDTDGDGLSDADEFDAKNPVFPTFDMVSGRSVVGSTRSYYEQGALDEALRRCTAAKYCKVPTSSVTHTDPARTDSDADGRTDYEEHYVQNVISIDGKFARAVKSDPNLGDSDYDSLNDGTEFAEKTDPTTTDSDGDGVDDYIERNSVAPVRRDPLTRDRIVTINFTRISWSKTNCDWLSGEDWSWELNYRESESSESKTQTAWKQTEKTFDTSVAGVIVYITGTPGTFVAKFTQSVVLGGTINEHGATSVESSYDLSDAHPVDQLKLGTHTYDIPKAACEGGTITVSATIGAE